MIVPPTPLDFLERPRRQYGEIETEQARCTRPAVLEAVVIGGVHEGWGELPCAFVTRRNSGSGKILTNELRRNS